MNIYKIVTQIKSTERESVEKELFKILAKDPAYIKVCLEIVASQMMEDVLSLKAVYDEFEDVRKKEPKEIPNKKTEE